SFSSSRLSITVKTVIAPCLRRSRFHVPSVLHDLFRHIRCPMRCEELAKGRTALPFRAQHLEDFAIDAAAPTPRRAKMQRRIQRHRHVERPPSLCVEQPPMVVVVVVPEKEEPLVEIPVPLEIALQQQPGPSVDGFAPIRSAFDGVDALRRFDRSSAKPHRLLPLFPKQSPQRIPSTLKGGERMSTSPGDGRRRWRRAERSKEELIERRFPYLDVCLNLDDDLG